MFKTYKGDNSPKDLKEYITTGWKEQKETGKVPAKIPVWYKYQIEIYNKIMGTLEQLETFATEQIHEEPLYAGLAVGISTALGLLVTYGIISSCLSLIFGKRTPPAPKPKRD